MYIDEHIPNYERHILHHMDISTKVALVYVIWNTTCGGNIAAQIWEVARLTIRRERGPYCLRTYVVSLRARDITYTLENYWPVDSNSNMWKYVPDSKDYPILSHQKR